MRVGAPPPPQPAPDAQGPPPAPPANRMGAVVSPDGRFIYYAQRTGTFTYNARFPLWQIYRHDTETGDVMQITNAQGSAIRPALSPDGKFMVFGTRHKSQTGLRVRNLETGAERWLAYPVTRDDQESRASRDTLPRYDFMPDGKSLIVPVNGRLQRIDFASGEATPIPFSAKVEAEIAPRVYTPVRVDDGNAVRARLIRWPSLSPDGSKLVFSAMNRLYVKDYPNGDQHLLTPGNERRRRVHAVVVARWTIDRLRHLDDDRRAHQARGGVRRRAGNADPHEGYYLDPTYTPDGTRIVFMAGAASDQLYSILMDTPPADERDGDDQRRVRSAASTRRTRSRSAGCRRPAAPRRWSAPRRAAAGRSSRATTTRASTSPPAAACSRSPSTATIGARWCASRVRAPAITRRAPTTSGCRRTARARSSTCRAGITSSRCRAPAAKRWRCGSRAAATPTSRSSRCRSKAAIIWTGPRTATAVTWAWGAQFFRQPIDASEPQKTDIVVEAPRSRPKGSVLLTGARIITMKGTEVIASGDVLVTDNRIAAVGKRGSLTAPAGTRTINVSGKTIMPGLVDAHSHMWAPRGLHQTEVWQYLANLAYGVTTTRDPQTSTPDVFAYADMVDAGMMPGPRVYATGPGVFSGSGIDSREAAFRFIKRYKEAYRTNTLKQYVAGDRIVRQWIIEACKEYGITATIEGSLDLKLNLTQMADGYSGQEHSLPIAPLYKDVTTFVAKTKTFYTPTILVAYGAPWSENYWFETESPANDAKLRRWVPWELLDGMVRRRPQWFLPEEYGHNLIAKGVADVVRAGGRAGLGSHGQLQGLGAHWETWNLASGGLTPHETLQVITIFSAEAIGLQQDVGSLEAGKLADLIVLDRNPLENIKNTNSIRYVMKNGELYEGDTLNMVWPQSKPLPKQFWWNTEPGRPAPAQTGK